MAITQDQISQVITGGQPEEKLELLKQLRGQLDAGELGVTDFLKLGTPLARAVSQDTAILGGQGSANASRGSNILRQLEQFGGFRQRAPGQVDVVANLPQEFRTRVLEESLPTNIDPELRQQLLAQFPDNLDPFSDQGQIELEGLRQKYQVIQDANKSKDTRSQRLKDLATFLAEQETKKFEDEIPSIAEQANLKGVFRSTGFGEMLTDTRTDLAERSQDILTAQGLSDRDADISALESAGLTQRDFQSQGLSRRFSLDDYTKQTNDALRLAREAQPQPKGKSGSEKAYDIAKLGVQGASTYYGAKQGKAGRGAGGQP